MKLTALLALTGLTLIALAYAIRTIRAIHPKIAKLLAAQNELRVQQLSIAKEAGHHYRQSEAFAQLIKILDFKAPIPATRGWAGSPDLLLTLVTLVRKYKPKTIVELGSGVSTLVLAKSVGRGGKVISVDNSEEYAGYTRELLKDHGIRNVQIIVAPLKKYPGGSEWYDLAKLKTIRRIDLLLVDGPPATSDPAARVPALAEFISKLSPRAVVVLDDAIRESESKLADAFAKALPKHRLTKLPHEKITAVIEPK
jgi:predicted O-methyltransferase YrrM